MKYEFSRQGEKFRADLPDGNDVKVMSLEFFGVNAAKNASESSSTGTGSSTGETSPTTTSPTAP